MIDSPTEAPPPTSSKDLRNCLLTLALAFAALLGLLYLADELNSFGFSMVLGVPLFVGAIVGHSGRFSTAWKVVAAVTLLGGALLSLAMWNVAGLLCTSVAAVVLLVPITAGAAIGHYFHRWQESRRRNQPSIPTLIGLFTLLSVALYAEARHTPQSEIEVVTTSRVLPLAPEQAWESLAFYEEIGREPPLLTRIGLPYPLRTEGGPHALGSLTRCVYSTGYLVKRISAFEPMRRLSFDVLEQHGVEDQSFELISGSFRFDAVDEGRTRVTLETTYRPLLQARFYWRPFEQRLAHVLHDYVLDGMSTSSEPGAWLANRGAPR